MRILHTSDWHIGKRLMERERLEEQIAALDFLVRVCDENDVDVVLVAGDVFDTFTPSAEAEGAFFRAAKALAGKRRALVAVSGNHDDGVRLCASAPLAGEDGIFLFGGEEHPVPLYSERPVHAVEATSHSIVLENGKGELLHINLLPYPNEARLREEKTEESYSEKISRWISLGDTERDIPHILLTHLFVAGGDTSDGERSIELGGARAVPPSLFPAKYYVALGHLHKRQKFGENIRYSGSLLQYSFDESADKSVILLEAEGNSVRVVRTIPVEGGKKLVRLQSDSLESACALLSSYQGCYVELTLYLKEPLTQAETSSLVAANGGLVSLITNVTSSEPVPAERRSAMSDGELFGAYYRSRFGEDAPEELKSAFLRLMTEEI